MLLKKKRAWKALSKPYWDNFSIDISIFIIHQNDGIPTKTSTMQKVGQVTLNEVEK